MPADISWRMIHRRDRIRALLEEGFRDRLHYDAGIEEDKAQAHFHVDRFVIDDHGQCCTELNIRPPFDQASKEKYQRWFEGFRQKAGGAISITPFDTGIRQGFNLVGLSETSFLDFLSEHVICRPLDVDILGEPGGHVEGVASRSALLRVR